MAGEEKKKKGCPNRALIAETCPCDVGDCPRRGMCCECIEFHRKLGDAPACMVREGAVGKPAEPAAPRGDDFRLTDFASCAG